MDSVVVEDDCGTDQSIVVSSIVEGGDIIQPLTERILGRVIAEPISMLTEKKSIQLAI